MNQLRFLNATHEYRPYTGRKTIVSTETKTYHSTSGDAVD